MAARNKAAFPEFFPALNVALHPRSCEVEDWSRPRRLLLHAGTDANARQNRHQRTRRSMGRKHRPDRKGYARGRGNYRLRRGLMFTEKASTLVRVEAP